MKSLYQNKTLGGILLVAGTSIGAGMLALPISTGAGGFFYSIALFLVCFAYMLMNLFLLLEANLYEPSMEANIISMVKKRLGTVAQIVGWLSFLLLFYAVAAAYFSGVGSLVVKVIHGSAETTSEVDIIMICVATVFGAVVFFGAWVVDFINRFFMIALIAAYFTLVFSVAPHVKLTHLSNGNPKYLLAAVPIVVLSFTSHLILPSLRMYLQNNVPQLKRVLLYGSLAPLFFYIVWEFLILGVLPPGGEYSLASIIHLPQPAGLIHALQYYLGVGWVAVVIGCFSFFALVTSLLAVLLGLIDFLADGFQIKKTVWGRIRLLLMTILPPLFFAIGYPAGFLLAISYAGVFAAILFGILPALMIWEARYKEKIIGEFVMPGGKPVLVISLVGACLVIFFQIATTLHWF